MFISLKELELRTVKFNVEVPAGQIEYDGKVSQSSALRVQGSARLLNHSLGEIEIHGTLDVTVRGACDRCLEPAEIEVSKPFDLLYVPNEEAATGSEDEIDENGIEVGYYRGSGLDLNDVLREVVLLALPMQLVCQDDCGGICPQCGQNLNQQKCGCQQQEFDNRWNQLKNFRVEIGPQN